jgi:hypothetical protein
MSWNDFFHYAGSWKRNGGERRSQRWLDTVSVWPDMSGQCSAFARVSVWWSDAGTVASSQFCSASGHCFVVRCSGLTSTSGQSRDKRVRSFLVRSVCATSASGCCFAASRCATGASGQLDQHVRSARFRLFKFLTALFEGVVYKYSLAGSRLSLLNILTYLWALWAKQLSSHLSLLLLCIFKVRLSDPSAFALWDCI